MIARILTGHQVEAKAVRDEFSRGHQPAIFVDGKFLLTYDTHLDEAAAKGFAQKVIDDLKGMAATFDSRTSVLDVAARWTPDGALRSARFYWDRELAAKLNGQPLFKGVPIEDGVWVGLMYQHDHNEQTLVLGYTDPVEAYDDAMGLLYRALHRAVQQRSAAA
jgi:hypothetical protein